MSDISGLSSRTPLAFYDPDSSSWKTSQATFLSDSTSSSVTLPRSGMTRRGVLYELPTLAAAMGELGCSLLPTPNAQESDPTDDFIEEMEGRFDPEARMYLPGRKWHSQRTLSRVAALLPTPTAGDAASSGSRNLEGSKAHPGLSLTDVVRTGDSTTSRRLLPTPMARDHKGTPLPREGGDDLNMAVGRLLPTPAAWDGDRGPDYARMGREASGGDDLVTSVAKLLPTPSAADGMGGHETRGGERGDELLLAGLAKDVTRMLPTPQGRDGDHTRGADPERYRGSKSQGGRRVNLDDMIAATKAGRWSGGSTGPPSPATPSSSADSHPTLWTLEGD